MRICSLVIILFCFCQLREPLTFLERLRCTRASFPDIFLKTFSGSQNVPSDSVANLCTPISMPTEEVEGCTGSATSPSVWTEMNQWSPLRDMVTFLRVPSISLLL